MKQGFYIMMAAATLALAACGDNESLGTADGPVEARVTAGIGGPAARAIDQKWNADRIGVWVKEAPTSDMESLYRNVLYTTASTGTTADFTAEKGKGIFFQDADETVTFAAYAPYQESAANSLLPGENGKVAVDTRDNNTREKQEGIDFLFAEGATASRKANTVTFADNTLSDGSDCSFHHEMAQLEVEFQLSEDDGFTGKSIADGSFNLGGLIHEGTFDVTTGETAATGEPADSWDITGCAYKDVENVRTYSLIVLPQDLSGKPLNVMVGMEGQTYKNVKDVNPKMEAGKTYTYTITVKKTGLVVTGCTISPWKLGYTGSGEAVM